MTKSLENQFLQFVGEAVHPRRIIHRKWLEDDTFRIYLRKEFCNGMVVLTINSASWAANREEEFKKFVTFMMANHPWEATFWETPCNLDIVQWCLVNGWEEVDSREFGCAGCLIHYQKDKVSPADFLDKWPWREMCATGDIEVEMRGA